MEESTDIRKHAYGRSDGQGAQSKVRLALSSLSTPFKQSKACLHPQNDCDSFKQLCIWNVPGDDVVGMAARSRKVLFLAMEQFCLLL